ncbi:hypothetical protein [Candidatus Methanoperedens nitratireducens]|uniref:Uncharacterized protein n=1 Tax=Candidatus Methanoperedens nitratireducens TaxID=1392998 RepID=A0A284VQV9_9EURY|nr:hypothetical protein [Candidatus Methanoperedens nitroreducens]SNQ61665.1 membrane hypothetical protein [Candidatus Methanoperedens nitroreducens]
MILKEIYYISLVFSLIAATIGIYLSLKSWMRLRRIELDTLKARAFLDKSFLYTNFKFTLVVIGLVFLHMILEYIELGGNLPPELHPVYYGIFPVAILVLVLMISTWHKLLYKENRNDT